MTDTSFLLQMVKSLDELETRLEDYYKSGDAENFNKTKKTMLDVQKRILGAVDAI